MQVRNRTLYAASAEPLKRQLGAAKFTADLFGSELVLGQFNVAFSAFFSVELSKSLFVFVCFV